MDDIYFSDKKRRDISSDDKNDFLETDYFDEEFSLDFKKSAGNAQSFISESGKETSEKNGSRDAYSGNPVRSEDRQRNPSPVVNGLDRTPHGKPVSQQRQASSAYQRPISSPPSRTPTGQRVSQQRQAPSAYQRPPAPPSPSRTASSQRAPQQGSRPHQGSHTPSTARQTAKKAPPPKRKVKKSSSTKAKILLSVFGIFVFVLLALFACGYMILGNLNYDDEIIENRYLDSVSAADNQIKNILFIGSDGRGDVEGQRSDTMILFSIDSKNRQIKLTSFLRDSYLYVPLFEYNSKINASYSLGGAQATLDALEYNFEVDIDNYVMVDFEAFEMIVDLLGGITVDVTADEAEYMRDEVKVPWVKEGKNDFNGFVALWYCRIRYLDDDFSRTARQRKVISAIIDKATKTDPFTLMNMVNEVVPNISTDLTRNELLGLGTNALLRYMRYDIVQHQIPADGTWYDDYVDGAYVLRMDVDENAALLQDFLENKVKQ